MQASTLSWPQLKALDLGGRLCQRRQFGEIPRQRVVNPRIVPMQKPHPPIWFPGTGSPESVIKKLKYVLDRMQPGYLLIYGNGGPMPHKEVMRSIELGGKEVIPALKEA
jgi:hypothetical protein